METQLAKEIVIAMIESGGIPFASNDGNHTQNSASEKNAKAVAAAFEIVYAGILESKNKTR